MAKKQTEMGAAADGGGTSPAAHNARNRCRIEEEASLILLNQGLRLPCQIEHLALNGCKLRMYSRFLAGTLVRVEILFQVCGVAQRLRGVTQWTDSDLRVDLRFVDLSERRREELATLIAEVAAREVVEREAVAPEKVAMELAQPFNASTTRPQVPASSAPAGSGESRTDNASRQDSTLIQKPESSMPAATQSRSIETPGGPRELRAHPRLNVDSSALLYLIDLRAEIHGRIIDLSMGGCLIHTHRPFPVGIFRRVETEFRLHGLPFRLAGVTQSLYGTHRVGIRFLDMSSRKREQLNELIGEVMDYQTESETASEDKCSPQIVNESGMPN